MGDVLEAWVMHDHKPITARLLAVKQRIHVEEARKQMQELIGSHANSTSKPYATWLLMGEMAPIPAVIAGDSQDGQTQDSMDIDQSQSQSQDGYKEQRNVPRMGMLLTDDAHLEDAKSRFSSSPSIQLYALSPPLPTKETIAHRVAAVSALTTIQHDLKSDAAYVKTWQESGHGAELGAIRAPADIRQVGKDPIPPVASTSKTPAAAPTAVKKEQQPHKVAAVPAKATVKKEETKATQPSKTTKAPSKPKRKLIDTDDEDEDEKVKATADMDVEAEEDDGPIGYADEPAKAETAPKLDKAEADRKRADAADKVDGKEDERRRRRQELMDMMDDDGEQDPDVEMAPTASTSVMKGSDDPKKGAKTTQRSKTGAAKSAKSTKEDQPSAVPDTTETQPASTEKPPKRRVRKQRKVIRKETTRNEKGYRVTRDVEGYESYSSDESSEDEKVAASKSKPRKSAATSSTGKDETPSTAKASEPKAEQAEQKKVSPAPAKDDKKESPAPAAAQPAKKTSGGGGAAAGGQRKLSSFFTKKK